MLIFELIVFGGMVVLLNGSPVKEIELNNFWTLSNENKTIQRENLTIPVGVYSAVSQDDPEAVLKSLNDVNMRWIARDNWTFYLTFDAPPEYNATKVINITFHGIDTVATITLNEVILGQTDNMFVRYSYNIKNILKPVNHLKVTIKSPIYAAKQLSEESFVPPECPPAVYNGECHMNFLRKMQASFAWDWGLAAPSMGIWKPVTLEIYDVSLIREIDVSLSKKSDDWNLSIRVYLETALQTDFNGELTVYFVDILETPVQISFDERTVSHLNPVIEFDQHISSDKVELWWPNGYGDQKLYHLHFIWRSRLSSEREPAFETLSQKSIRIGFRTIELVQEEVESGRTFYFRVNGVPIFMKGTNWIPSHILPEMITDHKRIKHLLKSTRDAHMNMMRLWGGGIYESNYFYDLADYYGILIWHDMMFACAMYPVSDSFLSSVQEEVLQNSRRINHHPSIAIWATNNENEVAIAQNWYNTNTNKTEFEDNYIQLYVNNIYKVLKENVQSDILISSPSNGIKSVEDGYLSNDPQNNNYGDIHYYNYVSNGFNPSIYPKPRFASEYGFQSLPSMTSWERTMEDNDNLTYIINHRQHHPLRNIPILLAINRSFPVIKEGNPDYWEAFLYFSQIAQAIITKTETEVYRSQRSTEHRTMGALYWQLNDVWVAPSWSSIDFYGNYKILHNWAYEFMAPITIIAHMNAPLGYIDLYVSRDTIDEEPITLSVTTKIYLWSKLLPQKTTQIQTSVEPNSSKLAQQWQLSELLGSPYNETNCFFEFSIEKGNKTLSSTFLLPAHIKNAVGVEDPKIEVKIDDKFFCQSGAAIVNLVVRIQKPAIFVYLELKRKDVEQVRFSKNGYIQTEPINTITLEYSDEACTPLEAKDIKVLTMNQFMAK